jgi:hypothetical protein
MNASAEMKTAAEETANCKVQSAKCKLGRSTRDRASAFPFSIFNFQFSIRFPSSSSSYSRQGVTLLEVLFSMGIVSVGLLGTILLIPLAAHQAKQGTIADMSARVGRNGFNEVTILSYDNPANWLYQNGAPVKNSTPALQPHFVPPGEAFCIDARLIASHGFTAPTPLGQRHEFFPYICNPLNAATAPTFPTAPPFPYSTAMSPATSPVAMPSMNRITVRSALAAPTPMLQLQADERFVSRHDLLFEKSDDDTFPPSQIDISPLEPNSQSRRWDTFVDPDDRLKRESEGNFSWMMTFAPKVDVTLQARDLYTMSLIVFHERNSSFPIDAFSERISRVIEFPGSGVGGGEVVLEFDNSHGLYTDPDEFRVRADSWIMLCSQLRTFTPSVNSVLPVFRWLVSRSHSPWSRLGSARMGHGRPASRGHLRRGREQRQRGVRKNNAAGKLIVVDGSVAIFGFRPHRPCAGGALTERLWKQANMRFALLTTGPAPVGA